MPVDSVVKLGGGLLADPAAWLAALEVIARAATDRRLVIVPGGGPFADAVRAIDALYGLADTTAHQMAILGMDQHAELIAERLPRATVVADADGVAAALDAAAIPVLAPSRWMRTADPLPHSWDVTSDSIAAWVAGALEASRLVLVKPAGSRGDLLDPFFARARPQGLTVVVVPADELDERTHLR